RYDPPGAGVKALAGCSDRRHPRPPPSRKAGPGTRPIPDIRLGRRPRPGESEGTELDLACSLVGRDDHAARYGARVLQPDAKTWARLTLRPPADHREGSTSRRGGRATQRRPPSRTAPVVGRPGGPPAPGPPAGSRPRICRDTGPDEPIKDRC